MKLTLEEAKKILDSNGGSLDLRGTGITNPYNFKKLKDGDYVEGRYFYADGILTHVKKSRKIGENYIYYTGKIRGRNVITDGERYAHCSGLSEGIEELRFKAAKDRGADQYRDIDHDKQIPTEEAIQMYRIITGACKQGTEMFLNSIQPLQNAYTVNEIIKLTAGKYGAETFKQFFKESAE